MVNFNGQISDAYFPPPRAAKYGDGFFETIRIFDGKIPFWKYHWQRMEQAFRILKFDLPPHYSSDFFQEEISKLIDKNVSYRIRLTIWRNGKGLYYPEKNSPIFLIEKSDLKNNFFNLNKEGIHIGIYRENKLPLAKGANSEKYLLPNIKSCNSLPFILANIYRKEKKLDDILVLNSANRIACGGSSNIFILKNNELFTPSLSEGCVAGTIRNAVIDICQKNNIPILKKRIFQKELKEADGIFLTNAISGIRWVNKINGIRKYYQMGRCREIHQLMRMLG